MKKSLRYLLAALCMLIVGIYWFTDNHPSTGVLCLAASASFFISFIVASYKN